MEQKDEPVTKPATEARQAVKMNVMRYVLGFGLLGVIIGLLLVWSLAA